MLRIFSNEIKPYYALRWIIYTYKNGYGGGAGIEVKQNEQIVIPEEKPSFGPVHARYDQAIGAGEPEPGVYGSS